MGEAQIARPSEPHGPSLLAPALARLVVVPVVADVAAVRDGAASLGNRLPASLGRSAGGSTLVEVFAWPCFRASFLVKAPKI